MIWHIFKKDWRMLRWPVLALAAVQIILAAARFALGHFSDIRALALLGSVPGAALTLLLTAFLIVLAVHQDALPGMRQDWLVRPIKRTDLLLSKFLFVVVLIHGPMFVTDVVQGLANGFSAGQSIEAALWRMAYVLFAFSMPVLAIAALTRNFTEVLIGLGAWFLTFVAFQVLPTLVGWTSATAQTGVSWLPLATREAVLFAAVLVVLGMQYLRRTTMRARALFVGAVLLGQSMQFVPWTTAFATEQKFSPSPGAASAVAVSFEQSIGKYQPALGQNFNDVPERPGVGPVDVAAENERRRSEGAVTIFLPLRVAGLPAQSLVIADRSEVRLLDASGAVLYSGRGNDLEVRAPESDAPQRTIHQGIRIPGALYSRIKDQPERLEIDYSLTLFRLDASHAMPARDGQQRMPRIGWCATRVNQSGIAVQFRCLQAGERPSCLMVDLQHTQSGRRNPEVSVCAPDYTPFPGHAASDALSRFGGNMPFSDPSGLARYPVNGPLLADSQVIVKSYAPQDHFRRSVAVPGIRLRDWEPEVPKDANDAQPR